MLSKSASSYTHAPHPKIPLRRIVFLSLLASLSLSPPLTSQAKTPKAIATKSQNTQKSPSISIPVTYKTYDENATKHPQIKKEIEKYYAEKQSKKINVVCNEGVRHRLLCIGMVKREASAPVHRFAGNLAVSSSTALTLIAVENTYVLVHGGTSPSPNATPPNTKGNARANAAFDAIARLGALSNWFAANMNAVKKNPTSHIIIYDIRDCNTNPQCPDRGSKNKSAKKSAKKTKS